MNRKRPTLLMCLFSIVVCGSAIADDFAFFENKIRPVLVEHCYRCHAKDAKKIRGGLLLDTRSGIRQGGDSGAGITPGEPDKSLVLDALRHESFEMPPDQKLSDSVIADFQKWIEIGAPDPRDGNATTEKRQIDIEQGRQYWAFQLPRDPAPPQVTDRSWPENEIDRFILSQLESNDLKPVADADRQTLIRRAYYALIGLPPSTSAIDEFVNDRSPLPIAFARVVDELLESVRFGERWGRHWLDVVRFAESSGGGRTLLFPEAWRYRDYVIDAFNRDLPFDRFVIEQIAGDLLDATDWQEKRRQITATAFLVLGPTNYELQDKDVLEMDIVDEQLDTIGKAFMGLTIGCARCHDHKFDPIPTRDYYAMAGILHSTKSVIHDNVSAWNTTKLPIDDELATQIANHEAVLEPLRTKLAELKKKLKKVGGSPKSISPESLPGIVVDNSMAEVTGNWTSSTSNAGFVGDGYIHDQGQHENSKTVTFSPTLPTAGTYEVWFTYTVGRNRTSNLPVAVQHVGGTTVVNVNQKKPGSIQETITQLGEFKFDPQGDPKIVVETQLAEAGVVIVDAVVFVPSSADKKLLTPSGDSQEADELTSQITVLTKQIKERTESGPTHPVAMAVTEREKITDCALAIRGVVHNAGPIIPRGALEVATYDSFSKIPDGQSGRQQLAEWIVSKRNPLTARVMVNRVWHWLFGEGLVRTVDNFGAMGQSPSHPELLDHLASKFVEDGWSVKRLVRYLMLSRTYRLSSHDHEQANVVDPENRWLRKMNRRRMDAESIRDTLLFLGGNLDTTVGGSNWRAGTATEYNYEFGSLRRSVYVPVFRNTLPEIFASFDFADPNVQNGRRTKSTIAPQALLLMNHPLVIEQANLAAEQLLKRDDLSREQRIELAFQQALARSPNAEEESMVLRFLQNRDDIDRWGLVYQTLIQSIDFRYIN